MSFLEHDFMQRALVAAALVGLAAPAIGIYLVQRRLSLMGDGIGHVAFTGVAAGLLTGVAPVLTAVIATCLGAVSIELLRERGRTAGDVALAIIFYGGIAGGVLLTSLAREPTSTLTGYLFGSVVLVNAWDLVVIGVVTVAVLGLCLGFRKQLFAVCYDEEVAHVAGLPVRALNLLIALAAAVTVAVTMRVVGILLVAAMLVLPVAAAQQVARSFRATLVGSLVIGVSVSVAGLILSYYADVYPAATIVLSAIAVFAVLVGVRSLRSSPV